MSLKQGSNNILMDGWMHVMECMDVCVCDT